MFFRERRPRHAKSQLFPMFAALTPARATDLLSWFPQLCPSAIRLNPLLGHPGLVLPLSRVAQHNFTRIGMIGGRVQGLLSEETVGKMAETEKQ